MPVPNRNFPVPSRNFPDIVNLWRLKIMDFNPLALKASFPRILRFKISGGDPGRICPPEDF